MLKFYGMEGDFFPGLQTEPHPRRTHPTLFPHRFLRMRVAYEDLIFLGLALMLVLLAGFCLGVERGKRLTGVGRPLALSDSRRPAPVEEFTAPTGALFRGPAPVARVKAVDSETRKVASVGAVPSGPFAIQLASYLDHQAAEAEARRVSRQGFNAQVIKQGRYFELRVVGYRSKGEAAASLAALRKTYHDSFIKKIESNKT